MCGAITARTSRNNSTFISFIVIRVFEGPVDRGLRGLHELPTDDHLIEDLVDLVEVED